MFYFLHSLRKKFIPDQKNNNNVASVDIAIVVHNSIASDARVRKQVRSLVQTNHSVGLFGYGDQCQPNQTLEDAPLLLIDKVPLRSPIDLFLWTILNPASYSKRNTHFSYIISRIALNVLFTFFMIVVPTLLYLSTVFVIDFIVYYSAGLLTFLLAILVSLFQIRHNNDLLFYLQILIGMFLYITALSQLLSGSEVLGIMILTFTALIVSLIAATYFRTKITELLQKIKAHHGTRIGYSLVAYKLAKAVSLTSPKIIHAHDMIALIAAIKIKKANPHTIVIWDAHELYTELAYKTPRAVEYIHQIIAVSAPLIDHFITINKSIASIYSKRYPKLPPAVIIMNATNHVDQERMVSSKLRETAQIDKHQFILLFQGGFSPGRGIGIMLEAAKDMPEDWTMLFMGSGLLEKQIEDYAKKLNCLRPTNKPAISKIPPAPYEELTQWSSGANLGIIPYENTSLNHLYCTPNKLWEYPNAGVPVLASGMIEMVSFIKKHKIGKYLPDNFTPQDINAALAALNTAELKRFQKNCLEFNRTENWKKYERALLQIYKRINK